MGEEEEELGVLLGSSSLSRRRLLGSPRLGDHNNHCKLTHSAQGRNHSAISFCSGRQEPGNHQQGTMQGEPPPIQNHQPPRSHPLRFPHIFPPKFRIPLSVDRDDAISARRTPRSSPRPPTPRAAASARQGERQGDKTNRRIGEQAIEFDFSLSGSCRCGRFEYGRALNSTDEALNLGR